MLWRSLMCYQRKHLWLICHIRNHPRLWCAHTQLHTEIFMRANYTIGLAINSSHIPSRIQILSWMPSDSLEIHALADTHQVGCAVNQFCEVLKGALKRSLNYVVVYPHVCVMTFINIVSPVWPLWTPYFASVHDYVHCGSVIKKFHLYLSFKKIFIFHGEI